MANPKAKAQAYADKAKDEAKKKAKEKSPGRKKLEETGMYDGAALPTAAGIVGGGAALAAVDAFTGEETLMNSPGETMTNLAMGGLVVGGGYGGMVAGGLAFNPNEEQQAAFIKKTRDEASEKLRKSDKGPEAQKAYREAVNSSKERFEPSASLGGATPVQTRNAMRGAAIGAAAALVPALLSMRDREVLANQSASLM